MPPIYCLLHPLLLSTYKGELATKKLLTRTFEKLGFLPVVSCKIWATLSDFNPTLRANHTIPFGA